MLILKLNTMTALQANVRILKRPPGNMIELCMYSNIRKVLLKDFSVRYVSTHISRSGIE